MKKKDILHNVVLSLEQEKIEKTFKKNRLKYRILKGLPVLNKVIPNPLNFKRIGDIDILTTKKSLYKMMNLLFGLGYQCLDYSKSKYDEIVFANKRFNIFVEIHLTAFNFFRSKSVDRLFLPISEPELNKLTLKILNSEEKISKAYTMLQLALHFALNHCFRGSDRLKIIALYLVKLNKSEIIKLINLIKKHKLEVYFLILFDLMETYNLKVPIHIKSRIAVKKRTDFYKSLYFYLVPKTSLTKPIDIQNSNSKYEVFRHYFYLNVIKIICYNQPPFDKLINCCKLLLQHPLGIFKYRLVISK